MGNAWTPEWTPEWQPEWQPGQATATAPAPSTNPYPNQAPPTQDELAFYQMVNDDPASWQRYVENQNPLEEARGSDWLGGGSPSVNWGTGEYTPADDATPNYGTDTGGSGGSEDSGSVWDNLSDAEYEYLQWLNTPEGIEWANEQGYGTDTSDTPSYESPEYVAPELRGYESSSNKDFYQQQFADLVGQQDRGREAEYAAMMRREEADAIPYEPIDYDQMWADRGVTPASAVTMGDNGNPQVWGLSNVYGDATPGQITNSEIYAGVANAIPSSSAEILSNFFNDDPSAASNTNWGNYGDPTAATASLDPSLSAGFREALSDMFNAAYGRSDLQTPVGGGPTAAPGYAPPITGGA